MKSKDYSTTQLPLGIQYSKAQTTFRVWSPLDRMVDLAIYEDAHSLHRSLYTMKYNAWDGTHEVTLEGDYHGKFYTFIIDQEIEVTDPYALSACANGKRGAVLDLARTNPQGWEDDSRGEAIHPCDAILYELHVKDFTGDLSSGAQHKGKFLGLSEEKTTYEGYKTGLDHIVDLGITHVHLMPVNDYFTVDETDSDNPNNYNWGYDPEHFNMPEGSYATDPNDPVSRVLEMKTMIKKLHDRGLKVVMDVVYNHTYRGGETNFNLLAPNYYYRMTPDGYFSNGSGCGNEFCSESAMGRRFILDSLSYWAEEYHIDGFRFDLMSLIDLETIKQIRQTLPKEVLIYGEPWMGGLSTLADNNRLYKGSQCDLHFALFNDEFRDAIKGDNDGSGQGFIQGNLDGLHKVKTGLLGSIPYDQTHIGFAKNPEETINYFNAHDNLILYDKLKKSMPFEEEIHIERINKMAFNVLLLAQGVPFFHAGNEFLRNKQGHHNSYNAPLSINGIKWQCKKDHYAFFHYVKDLIELRKTYDVFRLRSADDIRERVSLIEGTEHLGMTENAIVYTLKGLASDDYDCLLVAHNAQEKELMLSLSELKKQICHLDESKDKDRQFAVYCLLDEAGLKHEGLPISSDQQHLIRVGEYSSAVYKIKMIP